MKLYNTQMSGNCYKIRLLLSFLDIEHEKITINLRDKQQKASEFLAINPLGQVPVLEDQAVYVRDSQAILCYLACQYDVTQQWFPQDAIAMTQVLEWLFFANQSIASGLAAARAFYLVNKPHVQIEHATEQAHAALSIVNHHLAEHEWLVGQAPTIADIACYPYIVMASQGKIELEPYPYIKAWLQRFQALPQFIALDE
jgi:glutathione S-transferase